MIPEMMLCVHMKSCYDSRDDVMCKHKIMLIPEMMLCVHVKSCYDSRNDSNCTHCIMPMIVK